jgi:hypothetical protein
MIDCERSPSGSSGSVWLCGWAVDSVLVRSPEVFGAAAGRMLDGAD